MTKGMFPENYVEAYKMGDLDLKIPLFKYGNTTAYLKAIVESNESPDYLYALIYFVHDIQNKPGNILSGYNINFEQNGNYSYTDKVWVKKDVYTQNGVLNDMVSLRGSGPGDQFAFYIKKSVVDKTDGNFTVTLENLNLISYVPSSEYKTFDEKKKN